MKKLILIVGLGSCCFFIYHFFTDRDWVTQVAMEVEDEELLPSKKKAPLKQEKKGSHTFPENALTSSKATSKPSLSSFLQKEASPLLEHLPSVQKMREELKADPHSPAPSLLAFGAQVGQKMEEALSSMEAADALFEDLKSCALDVANETTTNVQAYCWSEMDFLSSHYPKEFKQKMKALRPQMDPRVLHITDLTR